MSKVELNANAWSYTKASVRIPKPKNHDPLVYTMAKAQAQRWLARHGVSSYQLGTILSYWGKYGSAKQWP